MAARRARPSSGIDIIEVDRIRDALARFGARFARRVLTPAEARLRARPAGDVRRPMGRQGGGQQGARPRRAWRRLARDRDRAPAHRPAGRAAARACAPPRAEQLGMGRIAVSISHERRTPSRSRTGSARRPARTSSHPTSRPARRARAAPDGPYRRPPRTGRPTRMPETAVTAGVIVLDDRSSATWLPRPPGARRTRAPSASCSWSPGRSTTWAPGCSPRARPARGGAGLVTLVVPRSLQPVVAGRLLEVMTLGLPETEVAGEVDAEAAVERCSTRSTTRAVVGPGSAARSGDGGPGGRPARPAGPPAVVDAEALNSLASLGDWPSASAARAC